jgi:hypothetical protein
MGDGKREHFAHGLRASDEVMLEATTNTAAIAAPLKPHVARVVVANPLQVRWAASDPVAVQRLFGSSIEPDRGHRFECAKDVTSS